VLPSRNPQPQIAIGYGETAWKHDTASAYFGRQGVTLLVGIDRHRINDDD
jgi:hypothetical protein